MSRNPAIIREDDVKVLYEGPEPGTVVESYKTWVTALQPSGDKELLMNQATVLHLKISAHLMDLLNQRGIETSFIRALDVRSHLLRDTEPLPFKARVYNRVIGPLAVRYGLDGLDRIRDPLVEFYHSPVGGRAALASVEHLLAFQVADKEELESITDLTHRANDYLTGLFRGMGLDLMALELNFSVAYNFFPDEGTAVIHGPLTPLKLCLVDLKTGLPLHHACQSSEWPELVDAPGSYLAPISMTGEEHPALPNLQALSLIAERLGILNVEESVASAVKASGTVVPFLSPTPSQKDTL